MNIRRRVHSAPNFWRVGLCFHFQCPYSVPAQYPLHQHPPRRRHHLLGSVAGCDFERILLRHQAGQISTNSMAIVIVALTARRFRDGGGMAVFSCEVIGL